MGFEKMKVGLIGGVNSSFVTLQKLVEHNLNITDVFGYKPSLGMIVSGYNDFEKFCFVRSINYHPFTKINDKADLIKNLNFDVLFIVGISQLVNDTIVDSAKIGCVGYHPTMLPEGRGRAPIAWLVYEKKDGAANFFVITDEADAGPIFIQEPFAVTKEDDAQTVEKKLLEATKVALDKWLPTLANGEWDPKPQNELLVTEFGVRKPDDGLIQWAFSADTVINIIRTSAPPHPGAYTFLGNDKVIINKVSEENELRIKGCTGRVLKTKNDRILVQTGDGLVWLSKVETAATIRVGDRLGYLPEQEIFELKNEIKQIKEHLGIN
jgi:methionyl-tRNA formyltransferase